MGKVTFNLPGEGQDHTKTINHSVALWTCLKVKDLKNMQILSNINRPQGIITVATPFEHTGTAGLGGILTSAGFCGTIYYPLRWGTDDTADLLLVISIILHILAISSDPETYSQKHHLPPAAAT